MNHSPAPRPTAPAWVTRTSNGPGHPTPPGAAPPGKSAAGWRTVSIPDRGWHCHMLIEPPYHMPAETFVDTVRESWAKSPWSTTCHFRCGDEGSAEYLTKARSKAALEVWTDTLIVEAQNAYTLPASGPDVYWNFIIPTGVTTTHYVRAIEIRPGDKRVVHHANLGVDRTRSSRQSRTSGRTAASRSSISCPPARSRSCR